MSVTANRTNRLEVALSWVGSGLEISNPLRPLVETRGYRHVHRCRVCQSGGTALPILMSGGSTAYYLDGN